METTIKSGGKPVSSDAPEKWMNVPLTNPKMLSEEWLGWTYKRLALDPRGRAEVLLPMIEKTDDRFAKKMIEMFPDDPVAKFLPDVEQPRLHPDVGNSLLELAQKSVIEDVEIDASSALADAYPDMKTAMGISESRSNKALSPNQSRGSGGGVETPSDQVAFAEPAVVNDNAANGNIQTQAQPGTRVLPAKTSVKLKPRTKNQDKNAEADLEAAKVAAENRKMLDAVESAERAADDAFIESAGSEPAAIARSAGDFRRDDVVKAVIGSLVVNTSHSAAFAVRMLIEAEDELDRVKRETDALLRRAQRKLATREEILRPKIQEWVATAERTSEKGIRLPGTLNRIVIKRKETTFTIDDSRSAMAAVEKKIGLDRAIAIGVVKVAEELHEPSLRAWLLERGADGFPGTRKIEAHDAIVLYRK